MEVFIKSIYKSIISFFGLPWVGFIGGLFLMVVPPIYALVNGITTLEPGFNYGVFYGFGLFWFHSSAAELFYFPKPNLKPKKESLGSK